MTDTRNKKPAGAKKTRAEEKKLNILYGTEVTVLPLSVADAVLRASKKISGFFCIFLPTARLLTEAGRLWRRFVSASGRARNR